MKLAVRIATIAITAAAMMGIHSNGLHAQAMAGRDIGKNRVSVDYYKTPPGRQDEWLALYKKYHRPIMDFQIQKGVTISSTLYAAKFHSPGMPWDFVIINVSPPEGEGPKLGMTRAEVITGPGLNSTYPGWSFSASSRSISASVPAAAEGCVAWTAGRASSSP